MGQQCCGKKQDSSLHNGQKPQTATSPPSEHTQQQNDKQNVDSNKNYHNPASDVDLAIENQPNSQIPTTCPVIDVSYEINNDDDDENKNDIDGDHDVMPSYHIPNLMQEEFVSELAQDQGSVESLELLFTNFNPKNFYFPYGDRYLVHHYNKVWYDHTKRESIILALTQSRVEFFTLSVDSLIDIICDYAYDKNDYLTLIVPKMTIPQIALSSFNATRNVNNHNDAFEARYAYDINYSSDDMIIYTTLNDINSKENDNMAVGLQYMGTVANVNVNVHRWRTNNHDYDKNKYVLLNNYKDIINKNFDNEYCVYQYCFKTYRQKKKLTPWRDEGTAVHPKATRKCFSFQIGIFLLDDHRHDSGHDHNDDDDKSISDKYSDNDEKSTSDCTGSGSKGISVTNIYYGWEYELSEYNLSGELCDSINVVAYEDHSWNKKSHHHKFNARWKRKDHMLDYDIDLLQENEYLLFEIDMNHSKMVLAGQTFHFIQDIPQHIIKFLLDENNKGKFCIGAGFDQINRELCDCLGIGLVKINFDHYCKMFPTHVQYVQEKTNQLLSDNES